MDDRSDWESDFNPARAINDYREVVRDRDTTESDEEFMELNRDAARLREIWKKWYGKDNLHEVAFHEPDE